MYVNGIRIKLKNHSLYREKNFMKRPIRFLVYSNEEERQQMADQQNPLQLSNEFLKWKYRFYSFRNYDVSNPSDVEKMKKIIGKLGRVSSIILDV